MTPPKAAPGTADWAALLEVVKEVHAVEIRILRDRIRELEARTGMTAWLPAGAEEPPEGKEKENPLRRSNPVQWVLDSVEEVIPLGNETARNNLRTWIQRQVRLRGTGPLDDILLEALAGDVTEGEEEGD